MKTASAFSWQQPTNHERETQMKALVLNTTRSGLRFSRKLPSSADGTRSPRQRASLWAVSHRPAFRHSRYRSNAGGAWSRGCGDSGCSGSGRRADPCRRSRRRFSGAVMRSVRSMSIWPLLPVYTSAGSTSAQCHKDEPSGFNGLSQGASASSKNVLTDGLRNKEG